MLQSEAQFLHERNLNFHASQEVEVVVNYLRAGGDRIPNEPWQKIAAFVGFLAHSQYVNDGILTGDSASIERQIEARVIRLEEVPDVQPAWLRERHPQVAEDANRLVAEWLPESQRLSLRQWADLSQYPDWFRYYVFESVVKLGRYDHDKGAFAKRSKSTLAAYPAFNPEALQLVYARVRDSERADFGTLYGQALNEVSGMSVELRKDTEGSWWKFPCIRGSRLNGNEEREPVLKFMHFLQVYRVPWCVGYEFERARGYLTAGDFYVYCTPNEVGVHCVPRIAVSTHPNGVGDVCGVEGYQSLERAMLPIAEEKIRLLPGNKRKLDALQEVNRAVELYDRVKADANSELSEDERRFVYQIGYFSPRLCSTQQDIRLAAIQKLRGNIDQHWVNMARAREEAIHQAARERAVAELQPHQPAIVNPARRFMRRLLRGSR